jgi:hypothetical protein
MKRMILVSVFLVVALSLGLTAQAGPVVDPYGPWSSPDDFTTKFWKEKFFGGGPGEPGNVLMAIGQGFVFQNAVLKEPPVAGELPEWCAYVQGVVSYITTYEGGMLTLNSSGPWLKKGNLKAKNVTATNTSCHDPDGNLLGFRLEMIGSFQKSTYSFDVQASFIVEDDNYEVKTDDGMVFQVGHDFDAIITIY